MRFRHILVAPDKFKGSLSAMEVCEAIERGIKKHNKNVKITKHPLADGGDGSIDILKNYIPFQEYKITVTGPTGSKLTAPYFTYQNIAFIELALASGMVLVNKELRNPRYTNTIGTGELILDAIKNGYREIVLLLGGSSTNDAGIGIASALGYKFLNESNKVLNPIGDNLINIKDIDDSQVVNEIRSVKFTILCDVKNKLFGEQGAAYIYGAQKGASKEDIILLNNGLINFAKVVSKKFKINISNVQGSGAAGGIAAGMIGLFNADIKSGIDTIIELTSFLDLLDKVDCIISGEGFVDSSSLTGKVISKISILAKQKNIPFFLFSGANTINNEQLKSIGIRNSYTIEELNLSHEDNMENAKIHLEKLAYMFSKSYV